MGGYIYICGFSNGMVKVGLKNQTSGRYMTVKDAR